MWFYNTHGRCCCGLMWLWYGSGSDLVRLQCGPRLVGIGQGLGGCTKCIVVDPPNLWGP
ncbi:hypothetical protein FIBSPDRAFT_130690 [Athelia psychrophila]|uniref:Uncharacterized protein n=1 Tax=Athelia psychrophila TaxID=1759441 RepID=A0A166CGN9_9AGAM|nr:hypothetical protein FIBSPDRAFT_130690 [Fibularhizoctonia sp. CBS 109695]